MGEIAAHNPAIAAPHVTALLTALGRRSIVLVGMMGAGKSSIGRRLASRLGLPFVDADAEIEAAAGMSIQEIFATQGEPYFRAGEARVISRLLDGRAKVLATGGGAFMSADTRAVVRSRGISIWLKADFDVLLRRLKRRSISDRPLLNTDKPAETLERLVAERYPIYGEADVSVQSRDVSHDVIIDEILSSLHERLGAPGPSPVDGGGTP
jgi:shikimate kinase